MQSLKNCLDNIIVSGDRVLVGVSGGADSMCLISLAKIKCDEVNAKLFAVHVNHNIRGEEAKRDEDFVSNFCKRNNIEIIIKNVSALEHAKSKHKTVEQAGRDLRYGAFYEIVKEKNINKLLVAHHKNDQAETVLMHIARGSSISGAKGMSEKNGIVLRPLINFNREEIVNYNRDEKIEFIEDSTNFDTSYTRNYIRSVVLPTLEKVYPSIVNSLSTFANKCAIDDEFINSMIPMELMTVKKDEVQLNEKVQYLSLALSSRLVKKGCEQLGIFADIEEKHILQIINLFKLKNGSKINLPNGLLAYKEYENVVLRNVDLNKSNDNCIFNFKEGEIRFSEFGIIKVGKVENFNTKMFGDGNHYIDVDKVPSSAIWRTRRGKDVFFKLGSNGRKSLSDYYIDKKVPKRKRDTLPILVSDNNVLVVASKDISESVKIAKTTKKVVKIEYFSNNYDN